jgi:serine/threonine protein kinase
MSNTFKKDYSFIFLTCNTFSKQFSILQKIGEGHSANVYKVQERGTKKLFAVKAFNHKNLRSKYN